MNRATIVLNKELPTWNECIAWAKSGTKGLLYASKKKKTTETLALKFASEIKQQFQKAAIHIHWGMTSIKKDPDNIASGIKFILDALTKAYILPNDTWKNVSSIHHTFSKEEKTYIRIDIIGE